MKIYLATIGCALVALLTGCNTGPSGLETYDNSQRAPAPHSPNFTQHLNNPYEDPRTAPGGRY